MSGWVQDVLSEADVLVQYVEADSNQVGGATGVCCSSMFTVSIAPCECCSPRMLLTVMLLEVDTVHCQCCLLRMAFVVNGVQCECCSLSVLFSVSIVCCRYCSPVTAFNSFPVLAGL